MRMIINFKMRRNESKSKNHKVTIIEGFIETIKKGIKRAEM